METTGQPAGSAEGDSNQSRDRSQDNPSNSRPSNRSNRRRNRGTPRRNGNDDRDYADPDVLRGIIQAMEERFDSLRTNQRRENEELQTRLLNSQDALMQMLTTIARPETLTAMPRNLPNTSNRDEARESTMQEEVRPSIEEIAGTKDPSSQSTQRTRPRPPNQARFDSEIPRELTQERSTPLSQATNGLQLRLSRNVPEADPLSDGTDPTYQQWRASIIDKLRENADHFETERSRCTHVWLKTTGLARAYLTPRYTSTNNQFSSVDEMLDCLRTYFLTGTEKEEARNRFNDMYMQDKANPHENFPEFKARFLANAIEGGVSESEWFFALWNKLPARIRLQNLAVKDLWQESFSVMVQHLTRVEMERARPSNRLTLTSTKKPTAPSATTGKSTSLASIRTSSSHSNTSPSSSFSKPHQFLRSSHAPRPLPTSSRNSSVRPPSTNPSDRSKCYQCGEVGHYKNECPNPPRVNEVSTQEGEDDTNAEEDTQDEVVEAEDLTLMGNGEA
jgi:chemotaxis protein histidine kinase CheA